jgi:DUF4097 and DUF4098 domain-containing protein YvlB
MTARTDRRLALVIGAALALLFTIGSAIQVASWTTGSVERHAHEVIPGPVRSLTIDANSGDVTLVPSDTAEVVIDAESSGTLHVPKLEVRPEGTRVNVSGGCPDLTFGHCSAEIIVRVPASATVTVEAGTGDIHAVNLSGNLDLRAASGDVSAADVRGFAVALKSASGDINASGLRVGHLKAHTASGDVGLQFARVPESVDAQTNSGDVAVLVPPGDELYRVDADTNSGDTIVGVAKSDGSDRVVRARTNSGDVVVDYHN